MVDGQLAGQVDPPPAYVPNPGRIRHVGNSFFEKFLACGAKYIRIPYMNSVEMIFLRILPDL